MRLDNETFLKIVDATPLVSIDLILRNDKGEILLGKRVNRPAADLWFVPGGRIYKNEKVRAALKRIALAELGVEVEDTKLIGAFDHIYDDNFAGREGISTHYVVLAYQYHLTSTSQFRPDNQHSELRWWEIKSLLASDEVHENTKAYFK
jgi:colanic acid biosynthesis protein WcaH